MLLLKWDDSYSVGINEIDSQHKKLIELITQLNTAMSEGKGKDVLGKIINELISYTKTHFALEEKLFDKVKYADSFAHKGQHKMFIEKVEQFKIDFEKGKTLLTIDVMNFLKEWLKNHILISDKKYAPYLAGKI